jgi:putative transposase
MHKASRTPADFLIFSGIGVLFMGFNAGWKRRINLGKRTSQNFVNVPFPAFVGMVEHKCALTGISAVRVEESYTSKCSFLDREEVGNPRDLCRKKGERGAVQVGRGDVRQRRRELGLQHHGQGPEGTGKGPGLAL